MKVLIYIFLFFCFFPYLDILGLGTDTQPNAIILASILLIALKNKKVNTPLIFLWLTFIFSIFLVFNNKVGSALYIRNTLNYLSPAIIGFAAYTVCVKYSIRISFKYFLAIVSIYLFVGLIQLYLFPEFLTGLVNGSGRGILFGGRGVVSLCPEPAFYGSMCIFLMVFSLTVYTTKQNLLAIPILLFQLFYLSRSATAVAILAFALCVFLIIQFLRFRMVYVFSTILLYLIMVPVYNNIIEGMEGSRIGEIYNAFVDDPSLITQIDKSVGVRFIGAVSPFLVMKHDYGKPQGIGNYKSFLSGLYSQGKYRNILGRDIIREKDRLGGSINMILFQLGIFGILFPLGIFLAFKPRFSKDKVLFAFIAFICLLFTQIQLMHAMIGFIIGIALYFGRKRQDINISY